MLKQSVPAYMRFVQMLSPGELGVNRCLLLDESWIYNRSGQLSLIRFFSNADHRCTHCQCKSVATRHLTWRPRFVTHSVTMRHVVWPCLVCLCQLVSIILARLLQTSLDGALDADDPLGEGVAYCCYRSPCSILPSGDPSKVMAKKAAAAESSTEGRELD